MNIKRYLRVFVARLVLTGTYALLGMSFAYAQSADLFRPLPADQVKDMPPAQAKRIDQIKQRATTKAMTLARAEADALKGETTRITLPDSKTLTFSKSSVETRSANQFTWIGSLPNAADKAILIVHDGNITGTIRDNGDLYRIEPVGSGIHAIIKVDPSHFPPEHPPAFNEIQKRVIPPPTASRGLDTANADGPVGIDVLVAYTPAAKSAVADIDAIIQLAVTEANQSYKNSGVNIKLSLVDSFELSYSESGKTYDKMVDDFAANSTVNTRRNNSGADMAALIVNQSDYCGMAKTIRANASDAFAAVYYDCATGYYSFAHELGHLQGARHDPNNDSSILPFAYGHGFQRTSGGSSWRTIMAYDCSGGCPRLQYWSNPNVKYNNVAMGSTSTNNNARVLNETASTVAAFRNRPPTIVAGAIWRYTSQPCVGQSCPGWQLLDNNAATMRTTADNNNLYQLHNTGKIWRYTNTPCQGSSCPGWQMIDNNAATIEIAADQGKLYQLHNTGKIWRYTNTACQGNACPGWQMIDNNPATIAIIAAGGQLYQLHNSGKIWRFTGTACSGNSCPGWQMLDNNGATVAIAAGSGKLYQLHDSGKIWRYTGTACSGNSCPGWQLLDNNPATIAIAAGDQLYQLHNTGKIWKSTGAACTGNSCPGWQMLDNNPASIALYAEGNQLFQLHNTGKIWRSTGAACSGNSCPGWQMLDNNGSSGRLSVGGQLYQVHLTRTPMKRARICYECR